MQGQAVSGQPLPFPRIVEVPPGPRIGGIWRRWRSLHSDILRHVRACDSLGVRLTVDQLAEDLDEALGLVERRAEELHSLRLIRCHRDRRVELDTEAPRMCG